MENSPISFVTHHKKIQLQAICAHIIYSNARKYQSKIDAHKKSCWSRFWKNMNFVQSSVPKQDLPKSPHRPENQQRAVLFIADSPEKIRLFEKWKIPWSITHFPTLVLLDQSPIIVHPWWLKVDWCDPGFLKFQLKVSWCCCCFWCWCWRMGNFPGSGIRNKQVSDIESGYPDIESGYPDIRI